MLKALAFIPVFVSLVACSNALVGCGGSDPQATPASGGQTSTGSGGTSSGGNAAGSGGDEGFGSGGAAGTGGGLGAGGGGDSGGTNTGGEGNASGGASGQLAWLPTWATTIQSLESNKADHVPPSLAGNTLRQFIWPTVAGGKVRIQLSNEKGEEAVDIQKVHIALAKTEGDPNNSSGQIDATTDAAFTFNGMPNVTIPAGTTAWSDGIDFPLQEIKLTAISIQFGVSIPSNITNHPGSRTTSYVGTGDGVALESLSNPQTRDRWYFIDALEVMAPSDASAIAVLGDSITDGYGTLNDFARWTDALTKAIQEDPAIADTRSVLNFGMGANTIATGSTYQDSGVKRFGRDVLTRDKVRYLIVLEGVNDITGSGTAQDVIDAYEDIIAQATAKGIKVFVSPLTPMNAQTNDKRDQINTWVRASAAYNEGVDFDKVLRDAGNPNNTQAAFKNDDLHPSPAGYQAMGQSVDLTLFH